MSIGSRRSTFLTTFVALATASLAAAAPRVDSQGIRDLVFLTEDNVTDRFLDDPRSGCDALSVASLAEVPARLGETPLPVLRPTWASPQTISPGRMTASQGFSMVVAGYTNHPTAPGYRTSSTFVARAIRDPDGALAWTSLPPLWIDPTASGTLREDRFPGASGIAVLEDDDTLLVTRFARWTIGSWRRFGPFVLEAYRMSDATAGSNRGGEYHAVAPPIRSAEIDGNAFEILTDPLRGEVHVLSEAGTLYSMYGDTFAEAAAPIRFAPPLGEDAMYRANLHLSHATSSPDRRLVFSNHWDEGAIVVSDLDRRVSWTLDLTSTFRTGGLDMSRGPRHTGLLAVHEWSSVAVYGSPTGDWESVREVARAETEYSWGRWAYPPESGGGPAASLAWSGDGSHIVVAEPDGNAEFAVFRLDAEAGELRRVARIEVCRDGSNAPNDVLSANGYVSTPPPVSSPTRPPASSTPTPTATETAAASPTPTSTASATATPMTPAAPLYLPLVLIEACDPTQVRIDVALVVDASSSMAEAASPGSSGSKLDAARQAVGSFLDNLALDAGDQAAIVSFSHDAWLRAALTTDRTTLDAALAAIATGHQTRLDRGLEVGVAALLDAERRAPGNEPVLIVLTDGRANPIPVEVAVERADDAKAAGITVFTIGLGEDLEAEALQRIASRAGFFMRAPTPGELERAYAEVARSLPCPPSASWGRR